MHITANHPVKTGIAIAIMLFITLAANAGVPDSIAGYDPNFAATFTATDYEQDMGTVSEEKMSPLIDGGGIMKAGLGITFTGLLTTCVGIYEMSLPDQRYKQDGKGELLGGVALVGIGCLITKLGADYDKNHLERPRHYYQHPYHSHHNQIYRNKQGFYRVSMLDTGDQVGLAYNFK